MPCWSRAEVIIATRAPAIMAFRTSCGGVHAPGDGEIGPDVTVEDGDPVQPHQQLVRARQREVRHDLEVLQIEVRQVEAVEQHQRVGARPVEARARGWPGR